MANRLATAPWWLQVGLIWLATRIASTMLFVFVAGTQGDNYWTTAAPGYFEYLNIWDSEWYQRIFDHGYPTILPIGEDGFVKENEWAFMAGYPMLVKLVSSLTGLGWPIASSLVSTAASFGFALVAYRLIRLRFDAGIASWSLVLIGLSPAAIIFQAGYAESLGLVLLALALYWWSTKRLLLAGVAIVAMSVTRPGAVAFSLAVGIVVALEWWRNRAVVDPALWPARIKQLTLAAVSGVAGFAWFGIAWLATGRFDAYLATELAWRRGYTGTDSLRLFESWFVSADFWLGQGTGALVVWLLFAFAVWMMFTPAVRSLSIELRAFSGAYLLYLALVFFPQSSTIRILLPAFGLLVALGAKTANARPAARYALIAIAMILQLGWLLTCWRYSPPDYSPP
jgi:hypothetical protein